MLWSEAGGEVVELSKRLDAPVMSSTGRDDVAPQSYPLYLGTIGRGALPEAQAFFKQADLVLAVGTSLGHTTTFWRPDFFAPGTKLIHIAQDRNNIGRVYPAEVGIQADAGTALKALLRSVGAGGSEPAGLAEKGRGRAGSARTAHRKKASRLQRPAHRPPPRPRRPAQGLAQGRHHHHRRRRRPRATSTSTRPSSAPGACWPPQGLAAIGIGYPVGLGAKLAAPKRPVVTISGDGSFLYNGAELETAVRRRHPTTCIILNNFNYGSERAYQKFYYDERYIGDAIGNPPFDATGPGRCVVHARCVPGAAPKGDREAGAFARERRLVSLAASGFYRIFSRRSFAGTRPRSARR